MYYNKKRESLIKKIILMAGGWKATGCKNEEIEKELDSLLTLLHPNRKTAEAILNQYLAMKSVA